MIDSLSSLLFVGIERYLIMLYSHMYWPFISRAYLANGGITRPCHGIWSVFGLSRVPANSIEIWR